MTIHRAMLKTTNSAGGLTLLSPLDPPQFRFNFIRLSSVCGAMQTGLVPGELLHRTGKTPLGSEARTRDLWISNTVRQPKQRFLVSRCRLLVCVAARPRCKLAPFPRGQVPNHQPSHTSCQRSRSVHPAGKYTEKPLIYSNMTVHGSTIPFKY